MTPAPGCLAVRDLVPVAPAYAGRPGGRRWEDWAAVAEAINARMAACRMSQQRLAEGSGISVATIRMLQRGDAGRRARDDTLAALSGALGWPGNRLLRVLLGEELADAADTRPDIAGAGKRRPASGDRRALAGVVEDLGVVVELLASVLDQLAGPGAAGHGRRPVVRRNAMSDVGNEECLYGVVSFADAGHTQALAVYLPFESPAVAHAYACRHGIAHSLVSPLAFDTSAASTASDSQDEPAETGTGPAVGTG